jgi:repeat uncharacterized protein DUF347
MTRDFEVQASKVPEVTLGFWMIKILATTLGETGGDTVTMTWLKADTMVNAGYLVGSAIFLALLIVLVAAQIAAKRFRPFLYWATIAASTTFGTAMADFADRSLGIGYTGGSLLLFACLMSVLALWYWSEGTISVNGGLLLGGHHIFTNAGNCPRRLDRRHGRPRVRRWSGSVRYRLGSRCRALLLDGCVAGGAVLGGVHSHATARGNFR